MRVVEVTADTTHDLRRRVLRGGRADADVHFDADDHPAALHLAVVDDDDGDGDGVSRVLAVATVIPATTPRRPAALAWRVRGMAVEPAVQGTGVGTLLLDAVVDRARAEGALVLWADGRDSALGFYQRRGWSVEGEGYLTAAEGIPHHTVVLDL